MDMEKLMKMTLDLAEKAYAPYSQFKVGALLLLADDTVIPGVNVENRSFGLTNCAERTAIFTAITRGRRDFKAFVIASPDTQEALSPCGACRQVISEFCSPDLPIYYTDGAGSYLCSTVRDLLPQDCLHSLVDQKMGQD